MKKLVVVAVALTALLVIAPPANAEASCTKDNWVEEEVICTPEGKIGLWEGEAKVSISFKDCGPAKLELGKKIYQTTDTCEVRWTEPQHDGLLYFFQSFPRSPPPKTDPFNDHYIISVSLFDESSNYERMIPLRIHYGGRMIKRWLFAVVSRHGAKKIWEGTDAFINVCIDRGLEIRSSGGVLYCETGGWVYRELSLERKPFR